MNYIFGIGTIIILFLIILVIKRNEISYNTRKIILTMMPEFIAIIVCQLIFPESYITNFCYPFVAFTFLYSFHNNYIDISTGAYNKNAFYNNLKNILNKKKKDYYVVSIELINYSLLQECLSEKKLEMYIYEFFNTIYSIEFKKQVKVYKDNEKMYLIINSKKYDTILLKVNEIINKCNSLHYENNDKIFYKSCLIKLDTLETMQEFFIIEKLLLNKCHENNIFIPSEEDYIKTKRTYIINKGISDLLENNNNDIVQLYLQPILNNQTNSFETMEALTRLKINDELYYPDEFIPILEKTNKIHFYSMIVLEKVCMFINKLKQDNISFSGISINFSTIEILEESFEQDVYNVLNKYNVSPSEIHIEITETTSVESDALLKEKITRMNDIGFIFYLDDFGTGYSNLDRILSLPFKIIKFDKNIVWNTLENENANDIVNNFIQLLISKGFKVLFEGVENQNIIDAANETNVSYLQGYHYSKPVPESETINFLKNHNN